VQEGRYPEKASRPTIQEKTREGYDTEFLFFWGERKKHRLQKKTTFRRRVKEGPPALLGKTTPKTKGMWEKKGKKENLKVEKKTMTHQLTGPNFLGGRRGGQQPPPKKKCKKKN